MNYDETIHKAEQLVQSLEKAEALSMDEYRKKSAEVKQLLDLCEQHLSQMEQQLLV